jgi:hypothetical protein
MARISCHGGAGVCLAVAASSVLGSENRNSGTIFFEKRKIISC